MRQVSNLTVLLALCLSRGSTLAQTWTQLTMPAGFTQISDFDIDNSGCWFVSDRQQGFSKSCNSGSTWTTINTGIPAAEISCGAAHIVHNPHDDSMIGMTVTLPLSSCPGVNKAGYYRLASGITTWAAISQPVGFSTSLPAQQPRSMPLSGGSASILSGQGASGQTAMVSSDDWATTALVTENPGIGTVRGTLTLTNGKIGVGTENGGYFECSDSTCTTINNLWAWNNNSPLPGNGEIAGIAQDCSGNLVIGSFSGIWKSSGTSPNYTWTFELSMTQRTRAVFKDSHCTLYAGQRQLNSNPTVWRSTDGGVNWGEWDTGIGTGLEAQRFVENGGFLYVNIQNGSTNAGTVWRVQLASAVQQPTAPASILAELGGS